MKASRQATTFSVFATRFALAWVSLAVFVLPATPQGTVRLKPETVKAFDQFVTRAEESMANRQSNDSAFLWLRGEPARLETALGGRIVVVRLDDDVDMDGGMTHHWIAGMFIPGATIDDVLAVLKNFDEFPDLYPEVVDSRLMGRDGDTYELYQRLRKKKVLTVVLDTWHDVSYRTLDDDRAVGWSRSTEIREVRNAGTPDEKLLPEGEDRGFVWRIYLYWRFEQNDEGVLAECQSISLGRRVPALLRWFVDPFIRSIPRDSLERSLEATRRAAKQTVPN